VDVSAAEGSVFKGRHFDRSVILLCIRWYLAYSLRLRDLEEMMAERGISVDHATVNMPVIYYSPELLERLNKRKRAVPCKGFRCKFLYCFLLEQGKLKSQWELSWELALLLAEQSLCPAQASNRWRERYCKESDLATT
jgi:hypothetical protein